MEEQKPHFVCTGTCGGVGDSPTPCQASDCPNHGQPLQQCNCTDGQHADKPSQ